MTVGAELSSSPALVQLYLETLTRLALHGLRAEPPLQAGAATGARASQTAHNLAGIETQKWRDRCCTLITTLLRVLHTECFGV